MYQHLSQVCSGIFEKRLRNTSHKKHISMSFSTYLASCTLTACLEIPVATTVPRTLFTSTPLLYEGHLYIYKALVLSTTRERLLVNEYVVPRLPVVECRCSFVVSLTHRLHNCADVWSGVRTGHFTWRNVVSFTHSTGCTTV